ncbi:MAG: hypothetical protein NT065_04185 [Chlamydiae bacterium]|nr:hypothetical protein [Chlamydiota bacterium]
MNTSALITYDRVLHYLADIESGAVESRCNTKDLERINSWLIAKLKGKAKSPLCIRFCLKGACSLFRK